MHANQQLVLDDNSQKLVTINTVRGLFCYSRLLFGAFAAPSIFQHAMESLLQGIPHVCVFGRCFDYRSFACIEHLRNLEEVLQRLQTAGM